MALATPWGTAQHQHKIARGIWQVDTAGHGGIMFARGVAQKFLSQAALAKAQTYGNYLCYEEDCNWAIPVYEQPALFASCQQFNHTHKSPFELYMMALDSLQSWNKGYLEQFTNEALVEMPIITPE